MRKSRGWRAKRRKVRKSNEWRAKRRRLLVCVSTSSITWLFKSYPLGNLQKSSECVLGAMKQERRRAKFDGNVKEGVQLQRHCKKKLILRNRHGGSPELDECKGAGSGELSHDFAARKSSQLDGEQFCMLQLRIRRVLLGTQSMCGHAKQNVRSSIRGSTRFVPQSLHEARLWSFCYSNNDYPIL